MKWALGIGVVVVVLGTLVCGSAGGEELTTTNLVPSMSGFTASGGTSVSSGSGCSSGAYCTSGTNQGGGTYTSTFAVPLTEAEVKLGFTLNSGITINSHLSNSQLATCTSVTQSGDCRDIFKLTINLLDDGTAVQSFAHQEELNWTGLKDFTFTDTVAANDYGILTGLLELYGIDAGWPTGFYGPQFSEPSLTIDYQTALIQQQVEQEIQQQIEQAAQTGVIQMAETVSPSPLPTETSTAPPPPPVMDIAPPAAMETSLAPPSMTATIAPPAAPTIAPISPPQTETQQAQEAQAEAQIEAVVEAQPEPETQPEPEAEAQPEPEAEPEATAEAEPEPEAEVEEAQPQQAAAAAPTKTAPKATSKATPKAKAKAKVKMTPAVAAQIVVDNIAPSQRYGDAAQTTTLVAMGMIGGNRGLFKGAGIADAPTFFKSTAIPDGPSIVDTMTNYRFGGQASAAHNALVESQWSK